MHRSLGFGSHTDGLSRLHFALARPPHITCKSIIQKVRHSFLWLLRCRWFPGLFHLSLAILFTFHSRYLFSIGVSSCLVLEVWFPFLQTSSWCSTLFRSFLLTGLFYPLRSVLFGALTPRGSLATTSRISLDFFSSRYLDVSVPLVFLFWGFPLWISYLLLFSYRFSLSYVLLN